MKNRQKLVLLVAGGAVLAASFLIASNHTTKSVLSDNVSANPGTATQSDQCATQKTITYSCYKTELTSIVTKNSPTEAFALVKTQYKTAPYVKSQCHQLVHVIGRAAYAKYKDLGVTFAHGDQFCWSGYYHGIMEQIAINNGTNYIVDNANIICAPIAVKHRYSFDHYNCVHGMGHGLMEALNGNLFTSLGACDKMTDSWEASSCHGGVFMQNIMTLQSPDETVDHKSAYLKADQPMYPCTVVDNKYKEQCYLMQTSYALQVENYDFSKVFSLCAVAPTPYQDTCYQSVGRDASGQSISDANQTTVTCLKGSNYQAQSNCIIGAAKDFVSYFHSDKQAKALCAGLPPDLQAVCTSTVTSYYATF